MVETPNREAHNDGGNPHSNTERDYSAGGAAEDGHDTEPGGRAEQEWPSSSEDTAPTEWQFR